MVLSELVQIALDAIADRIIPIRICILYHLFSGLHLGFD